MKNKSKLKLIVLITISHAILSLFLFVKAYSMGMRRFLDTGGMPSYTEKVLSVSSNIILSPIFYPMVKRHSPILKIFPGSLGYIPIMLNSLFWASCLVLIISKFKGLAKK